MTKKYHSCPECQWKLDNRAINFIQFHTNFDQKTKNKMISKIEARQNKKEQQELNANKKGKTTKYYKEVITNGT